LSRECRSEARAVGPWNFADVTPRHVLGRFNGFLKSIILRVSEARDLGDVDRFAFYDHMKLFTAAPPDRCAGGRPLRLGHSSRTRPTPAS
jgi:hypothetical protein